MHPILSSAPTTALLAATGTAQTTTFPLNPRATFLRTNNDTPLAPLVVDLTSLPAAPGSWLRITTVGAFRHINGGPDTYSNLCGVFSSNTTLLASNLQQRVPGAIAAGPAYASGGTYQGNLPMDIPQDFFCNRPTFENGVYVEVPVGATHLFLGVHDSLYNDNVDPNGDFAAVVTVVPTPALPGTGEHVELRSGVSAPATALPADKPAPTGSTILGELHDPHGFAAGSLYVLAVDFVATGGPVPQLLQRVWLGSGAVVAQVGVIGSAAGWSANMSLLVPPGLAGVSLVLQGGALTPDARNGLYETSIAHRFAMQ